MLERFLTAALPWSRSLLVPSSPCAKQALSLLPQMQVLLIDADLIAPSMAYDLNLIKEKGIALGVFSEPLMYVDEPLTSAGLEECLFRFNIEGGITRRSALKRLEKLHSVTSNSIWTVSTDRIRGVIVPQRSGFNTIWVADTEKGDPSFDTIQTNNIYGLLRLLAT